MVIELWKVDMISNPKRREVHLGLVLKVDSQGHKPIMGRSQLICTGGSLMVTVQYSNDYKDDKNEALHTQYIFRTDVPHGRPAFHATGTGVGAALDGGISVLEIVVTTPDAFEVLRNLVHDYPTKTFGVGTVLQAKDAKDSIKAGAKFLMSPATVMDILDGVSESDVLYIPGVMTPTEVYPVSALGGVGYISALKKPFSHIPMVASQGVTIDLVGQYIGQGASAVVLSDAIFAKEAMSQRNFDNLQAMQLRRVNKLLKGLNVRKIKLCRFRQGEFYTESRLVGLVDFGYRMVSCDLLGKRMLHLARDDKERASSIDEQRIDGALGIALFFSPFLSASSDPFVRNFFVCSEPLAESNPVPQDPISAIHPPCIYAGDVASAIGFGL
ncbi:putative cytochrome c biosynthesis protein [Capsicum baccatum]|uniref:Cytochrome c biosynthesis protein n=1 Tax=Capsicum baccatum TaxID=33114 RepID=A0A2G2V2F3_CAPBA|nr:putative cytochrome c biosynthesis protein [Capsicum baccatum]